MLQRLLFAGIAAVCSGCVGFLADVSDTQDIRNPVPLKSEKPFSGESDRWACQPPDPSEPLTRQDFLAAWGEPAEKLPRAGGETWVYADRGRWCGALLFVIVPIPAMLPMCDTYDRVHFEGERAVRAESQRLAAAGAGFGLTPYGPMPFSVRPGRVTERRSRVGGVPGQAQADLGCALNAEAPGSGARVPPASDLVNCVSGGERRWTQPANCD